MRGRWTDVLRNNPAYRIHLFLLTEHADFVRLLDWLD